MPGEVVLPILRAGRIVPADWRGDALPKEPNKLKPAVAVEQVGYLGTNYPKVTLVPLTEDPRLAPRTLSLHLQPTAENGCSKPCWAASSLVAATSKQRVRVTKSAVTSKQLEIIRQQIASAIGVRD